MMSLLGTTNAQLQVHIRWMIRRDMPEVLAIEAGQESLPWMEDEFLKVLRQRNCIGMVAEADDQIVGFMIYELNKHRLQILNFAVHPKFRRRGVATQIASKLMGKLSSQRRTKISLHIRETNLPAQLFFRAIGFKALEIAREHFDDTGEDAYVMNYAYSEPAEVRQLRAG
jgi:ribosomal-protein-alanine N-acetyltransferase